MLREQPWAKATITVAGDPELDHGPETEIVVGIPAAAQPPRGDREARAGDRA